MITEQAERTLLITRVLAAPRELVFAAWTDPKHLAHWMGPHQYETTSCKVDLHVGGTYRICITGTKKSHWMRGTYQEVTPPRRLVFTFAWEDEHGEPVHETLVTLTFEEEKGKTKMTFHQALFRDKKERDDHEGGWTESFERLAAYVEKHEAS